MAEMAGNPCVLLQAPKKASVSKTHLSTPNLDDYPADYVLLRIAYVGVCGSDVHFYLHGGVGPDARMYIDYYRAQNLASSTLSNGDGIKSENLDGLVMGHEASATVIQIGAAVSTLQVGDRVALEPGIPCRTCSRCIEGNYHLCFTLPFAASFYEDRTATTTDGSPLLRAFAGTLSKYYVLPAPICHRLPPQLPLKEGALVEPLAVAVHAARLANIDPSPQKSTVLVTGAGTIGTVSAAVACAYGASHIILTDIDAAKLSFAKSWLCSPNNGAATRAGARVDTFLTTKDDPAALAARLKRELKLPIGPDVALETSGAASAVSLCICALRSGGDMVQTGLSSASNMSNFPIMDLSTKELHMHGAFRYKSIDFEVARDLVAKGLVGELGALICRVFEFEEFEEAWKATAEGRGSGKGVKNMIRVGGEDI